MQGNKERLLTELLLAPNIAQYNAVNNCAKVTDDSTVITQVGKYQVMSSPSYYNSSLVLSFGWESIYITPILSDEPKTVIVSTKGNVWDEIRVKQTLTEALLDAVFRAVKIKSNLGTYHKMKSGRGVLAWNFHNYQVYYKG